MCFRLIWLQTHFSNCESIFSDYLASIINKIHIKILWPSIAKGPRLLVSVFKILQKKKKSCKIIDFFKIDICSSNPPLSRYIIGFFIQGRFHIEISIWRVKVDISKRLLMSIKWSIKSDRCRSEAKWLMIDDNLSNYDQSIMIDQKKCFFGKKHFLNKKICLKKISDLLFCLSRWIFL